MKNNSNFLRSFWILLIVLISASSASISAQNSREYIRNAIKGWGSCRNVSITKRNGDIALYGRNGWAASGCSSELQNEIRKLNGNNEYIDDIQLSENGNYVILYGNNGLVWNGISSSFENQLRKFNRDQEVITSVTFNDDGDWIVITKNYFSTSDSRITQWLKDGCDDYGKLWTACITEDSMVAVFENGFKFFGNVPDDLKRALKEATFNVVHVKIAGTAWFFSDNDGHYRYNM